MVGKRFVLIFYFIGNKKQCNSLSKLGVGTGCKINEFTKVDCKFDDSGVRTIKCIYGCGNDLNYQLSANKSHISRKFI